MKPIAFPQSNATLTGGPAAAYSTENDVVDLPVYRGGGEIISCWRPSWRERLTVLMRGRVWLRVLSSGSHPPVDVDGIAPWVGAP